MLKHLKDATYWPFIILMLFLISNVSLIAQNIFVPSLSGQIPWIPLLLSAILAIIYWKAYYGDWPKNGLITAGTIISGIVFLYAALVLLPENELLTRRFKMILVILGGLVLLPLSYHLSRNYQIKHPNNEYAHQAEIASDEWVLSKLQIVLLWSGLASLIFSFFALPIFSRSDIIGWDPPTHIFRARLFETFGINEYNEYSGGFQITFRMLSTAIHGITGINYLDIVRILPPILLVLICFAAGYFAFTLYKNHLFALITSLFTFAWVLSPWMISNLFDNLMVTFFGLLFAICFIKSYGKNAWIYEVFQVICLALAGISHLTLASIFFITAFHVNFFDFYENYWLGGHKNISRHFWRMIRVPLISGIIVIGVWLPALVDFVNSLAYGLQTNLERNVPFDTSFSWIIKYYNLAFNLPWVLLGFLLIVWSISYRESSRSLRIVLAWSTVCFVFGIGLHPISFLNSRFFIMTPIFLLIPLGITILLSKGAFKPFKFHIFTQKILSMIMLGLILTTNLIINSNLMISIPGLATEYYQKFPYINQYIETNNSASPYIFLVEYTGPLSETYSDLWLRIIRSQISERGLVNSYLYFGTLEFLLQGKETHLENDDLPEIIYKEEFSRSSQMWFDILEQDQVLETSEMSIFIIDSFNEDMFEKYQYMSDVDTIGPGILVINIRDNIPQHDWGGINP